MSYSFETMSSYGGGFPLMAERRPRVNTWKPRDVPALSSSFSGLNSLVDAAISSAMLFVPQEPQPAYSNGTLKPEAEGNQAPSPDALSEGSSSYESPRTGENTKKRARESQPHPLERGRRVRPKVVAEKGAIQCIGENRKKGTRCRNAALMEYIGPRPLYCAEHITLDVDTLYCKCGSPYQKTVGDGKGCREVVLKEFQFCHKHFDQSLDAMLAEGEQGLATAQAQYDRVCTLLTQLEAEAASAKSVDPDLFQRKHKLIPKFVEMKRLFHKRFPQLKPETK